MVKIYLAHNTHNRPKTMFNTLDADKVINPTRTIVSVTTDGNLEGTFETPDMDEMLVMGIGHQVNCINAFYGMISYLCTLHDDGIIIFSHDDVPIVNKDVVEKNIIELLENELSFIVRNPINFGEDNYYMMEVVYLRIKYIRDKFSKFTNLIFNNINQVNRDKFNKPSAEAWLATTLKSLKQPGKVIKYTLDTNQNAVKHLENTMGYTHLNYGIREWKE